MNSLLCRRFPTIYFPEFKISPGSTKTICVFSYRHVSQYLAPGLIMNMSYSTEALPFWNGTNWFVTFCHRIIILFMIDGITKVYQSNHVIQYWLRSTFLPVFSSHTAPSSLTTLSSVKIIYKTQEVFLKFWLQLSLLKTGPFVNEHYWNGGTF